MASQNAAEHVVQLNRSAAVLAEGGRAGEAAAVAAMGKSVSFVPADTAGGDGEARGGGGGGSGGGSGGGGGGGGGGAAGDGLWRGGEFALGEQRRLAEEARMREAREEQRLNVARQACMCMACAWRVHVHCTSPSPNPNPNPDPDPDPGPDPSH